MRRRLVYGAPLGRAAHGAITLLALGFTAACSSDSSGPEVRDDELVEIRLVDFAFTIPDLEISQGTRVRWIATTGNHTITPDGHSEWQRFPATGLLAANDTFEHAFDTVGEFPYFCEPHRSAGMEASITVRAAP